MSWVVARQVVDKKGKVDATTVFVPESNLVVLALRQAGIPASEIVVVNLDRGPEPLWKALKNLPTPLEGFVYVGHGLTRSLPSLRAPAALLALRLYKAATVAGQKPAQVAVLVTLFACSAADGVAKGVGSDGPGMDGGYADELRDELCRLGATWSRVFAHTTSGRSLQNPYLAVFEGEGSPIGGQGGRLVVRPRGPGWAVFKKLLEDRSKRPSFRHRIPLLTSGNILAEVGALV